MRGLEFADRAAWLEWRRSGLGASDIAVVLGLSKYRKPFELFEEKTGRVRSDDVTGFAAAKGNELEPVARKKFAVQYNWEFDADEEFSPLNLEHPEIPYLRASLDGISRDGKTILEIKYQGVQAHNEILNGIVNPAYMAQIQAQLLVAGAVTGAGKAYLCSIGDDQKINAISIVPNEIIQNTIVDLANDFWSCVQANRWPGESEDAGVQDLFEQWKIADDEVKKWDGIKRDLQAKIFATNVTNCNGYVVRETTRKGVIKYSEIPALKGLDLENYRSPDISFKQIVGPK